MCVSPWRNSGVQFLISPRSTYLRTRRFNRPTFQLIRHTNLRKNTAFRDFAKIWRGCIFFLLTFTLVHLFASDLTACLICFQLSILSEVCYLNFLRWYALCVHDVFVSKVIFHAGFSYVCEGVDTTFAFQVRYSSLFNSCMIFSRIHWPVYHQVAVTLFFFMIYIVLFGSTERLWVLLPYLNSTGRLSKPTIWEPTASTSQPVLGKVMGSFSVLVGFGLSAPLHCKPSLFDWWLRCHRMQRVLQKRQSVRKGFFFVVIFVYN